MTKITSRNGPGRHSRPIVVVSRCLELEACRYNAERIRAPFVTALTPHVDLRPVCPEIEIGLGVPRQPIRIVSDRDGLRLVQPSTGRDLTGAMRAFAGWFLAGQGDADGFILKSRSPSCGIKETKFHSPGGHPSGKGAGFFGQAVLAGFPHAAVEDEARLTNFRLRHHFLTKLFTRAAFRTVKAEATMRALVAFHTERKLLLMAYHQGALRGLGRVVANRDCRPAWEVLARYESNLSIALARPARSSSNVNVLMHALGYFSDALSAAEKRRFLAALERYRARKLNLSAPLNIVRSWIARFGQEYLERQVYFEPYPAALLELTDSGREADQRHESGVRYCLARREVPPAASPEQNVERRRSAEDQPTVEE